MSFHGLILVDIWDTAFLFSFGANGGRRESMKSRCQHLCLPFSLFLAILYVCVSDLAEQMPCNVQNYPVCVVPLLK